MRTEPLASMTAGEVKFSEAISWSVVFWRSTSRSMQGEELGVTVGRASPWGCLSGSVWCGRFGGVGSARCRPGSPGQADATNSATSASISRRRLLEHGEAVADGVGDVVAARTRPADHSVGGRCQSGQPVAERLVGDGGRSRQPRHTSSRKVNVRANRAGCSSTTSRTCSRAMPMTRSAGRSDLAGRWAGCGATVHRGPARRAARPPRPRPACPAA